MSALTKQQKSYLAQLAARAYDRAWDAAAAQGNAFATPVDVWRRDEVAKACGKFGLRCCGQSDYKLVEGHFLDLAGQPAAAMKAFVRAQSEGKRQADAVLRRECERFGFHLSYADAICRHKFKCALADASDRQTWKLVYDIKRNGAAKRKREASGVAA